MARESSLWNSLKQVRLFIGDRIQIERIENLAGKSYPDVDGFVRGWGPFQFELKAIARPARESTPLRFKVQDGQPEWNATRWGLGGNNWWLLQVGEGSERAIYLLPGDMGALVVSGPTEHDLALACHETGGNVFHGIRYHRALFDSVFSRWESRMNALAPRERHLWDE
jgi:hypothetical protein